MPIWDGGIDVFNISNPTNPILENTIFQNKTINQSIKFVEGNKLIFSYRDTLGMNYLAKYDVSDICNPSLLYEVPLNYSEISLVNNPAESEEIIYVIGETYPLAGITIMKYDLSSDENANLLFSYQKDEDSYYFYLSGFFKKSTISTNSSLTSLIPATSSNVTFDVVGFITKSFSIPVSI